MMIPIDKMSTTDKVIESIRSYIQEPGRNPGEKLPTENELGKQLGVGRSSIREALRVLDGVEGIAQCFLTEKDVVRHELVQRIVKAYAQYENKKGKGKPAHGPNRTAAPAGRQPSPGARFAPHSAPGHKPKKNQQKENTSWKTSKKKK